METNVADGPTTHTPGDIDEHIMFCRVKIPVFQEGTVLSSKISGCYIASAAFLEEDGS